MIVSGATAGTPDRDHPESDDLLADALSSPPGSGRLPRRRSGLLAGLEASSYHRSGAPGQERSTVRRLGSAVVLFSGRRPRGQLVVLAPLLQRAPWDRTHAGGRRE